MRPVSIIRVYNLVNPKGTKLQLRLARIHPDDCEQYCPDSGYRWSFLGKEIPMPVRSGCWFNGFPESVMLDWLKGNGWALHTVVNMANGKAEVFELPNGNEPTCKGDKEIPSTVEDALDCAVRLLWNEDMKLKAGRLYRHIKGGTLGEAATAIREIVDQRV